MATVCGTFLANVIYTVHIFFYEKAVQVESLFRTSVNIIPFTAQRYSERVVEELILYVSSTKGTYLACNC